MEVPILQLLRTVKVITRRRARLEHPGR